MTARNAAAQFAHVAHYIVMACGARNRDFDLVRFNRAYRRHWGTGGTIEMSVRRGRR